MNEQETGEVQVKRPGKWQKRILFTTAFVCILMAAWGGWYWRARAKLESELEVIRAAGEPTTLAELAPPAVADADNAAVVLKEAWQLFDADVNGLVATLERDLQDKDWQASGVLSIAAEHPELREVCAAELADILAKAAPSFKLIRQARGMKACNWGLDYSEDTDVLWLPNLSQYRRLSKALALASVVAHEKGHDAEALELVRDNLAIGRAIGVDPVLLNALVEGAIEALAVKSIEVLVPELVVGGNKNAATRKQVTALIESLLDESGRRRRFERCFLGERVFTNMMAEKALSGEDIGTGSRKPLSKRLVDKVLLPLHIRDQVRLLERMGGYVEAAKQDSLPAAEMYFFPNYIPTSYLERIVRPFSVDLAPSLDMAFALWNAPRKLIHVL